MMFRLLLSVFALIAFAAPAAAEIVFKRMPNQYIAALGDPMAKSGKGAEHWGLWTVDPGPRGVHLDKFSSLETTGGMTPAKWQFNQQDWWIEERGYVMEAPQFPLPPGHYVVSGAREVTSLLSVFPPDKNGEQSWSLAHGASIYDVTHLRCRAGRYTPVAQNEICTPNNMSSSRFPVSPADPLPEVKHCAKQDYQVLIVIGKAVEE